MSKMYSPKQVGVGTFIGGPFAAIYFLKGNFDVLGKEDLSKNTLQIGLAASLLMLVIMPFIPDATPDMLLPMLYIIPTLIVVKNHQMTKEQILSSNDYEFQSNWKVFGMSIAWLLLFIVISVLFIFFLEFAGIVDLD